MSTTILYLDIDNTQWPIVYRPEYNVHFWGLEQLHPFDSRKWGNVFELLKNFGLVNEDNVAKPNEATMEDLLVVHEPKYLKRLNCSFNVARIVEISVICLVPNCIVQRVYLKPMRYQTGGSILSGKLALERGWAINLGGGFHHCSKKKGEGFCVYADITLLIQFLFIHYPDRVKKVMIIDLDAHQGNGYQHDFKGDNRVYILDVYNKNIFPKDVRAKEAIDLCIELNNFEKDDSYLESIDLALEKAFKDFKCNLVVYNAGTDILKGDRLGCLSISKFGVVKRDEKVFRCAKLRNIPIVMLTSGGYTRKSARVIGSSILNLYQQGVIESPKAE